MNYKWITSKKNSEQLSTFEPPPPPQFGLNLGLGTGGFAIAQKLPWSNELNLSDSVP